ncbi:hypothetical protein D3C77_753970 [compost metagenome]
MHGNLSDLSQYFVDQAAVGIEMWGKPYPGAAYGAYHPVFAQGSINVGVGMTIQAETDDAGPP